MCKEISSNEVKKWLKEGKDFQIIDVREPYEFEEDSIKGAQLIPLGQFQSKLSEVDDSRPTVFVCRSGSRSGMACQFASSNGHQDCYNLVGGMMGWHYSGF